MVTLRCLGKEYSAPASATSGLAGYSLEGQKPGARRCGGVRTLLLSAWGFAVDVDGAGAVVDVRRTDLTKQTTDQAAHEAASSPFNLRRPPTDGQQRAGNYKKGHLSVGGLDVAVENPAGSLRRPEWPALTAHYGYVKRTEGADGDEVDCFVRVGTPEDWSGPAHVVDQVNPATGAFDEHKVMVGWHAAADARAAYLSSYAPGWQGLSALTTLPWDDFTQWLRTGDTKSPVGSVSKRYLLTRLAAGLTQEVA